MFNNREIAVLVWGLLILVFALRSGAFRGAVWDFLNGLRNVVGLGVLVALLAGYSAAIVMLLARFNLWVPEQFKDTVLWFMLSGVATLSYLTRCNEKVLRRTLRDTLRITILFEFLVATYTFSLLVELALVPTLVLLGLMTGVASTTPAYASAERVLRAILALAGVAVLANATSAAIADWTDLSSLDTLRTVGLAPMLSLLVVVPSGFAMQLYSSYERAFLNLRAGPTKSGAVIRYAKWQLVRHLGIKPSIVAAFLRERGLELAAVSNRDEVDALFLADE